MKASEEMTSAAVIAGGDMAKMLQFVEEALDAVAQPIGDLVVGDSDRARSFGWDDRFGMSLSNQFAQGIAVVGLVGNDAPGGDVFEQLRGSGDVMRLAAGENEAQRPALGIGKDMDLGRQSSSRTPQSLVLAPPFPVAACWWARTRVVSSIRYWLSGSPVRLANTRSHTPAFAQRVKRLCTVFHFPYRSGRSLQRAPERSTHKTPFTNSRLSPPVRPGSVGLPGNRSSMRRHCTSDSSYRLTICSAPNHLIRSTVNQRTAALGILNVDWT